MRSFPTSEDNDGFSHQSASRRPLSDREMEMARRSGWNIVDFDIPDSAANYHVVQCDGAYGQRHFGIVKDLSAGCTICKLLVATREKQCVQHIYIEGRRTFEFVCARGHHYLASSNKKALGQCPVCKIEDESKQRGRTILFDGVCTYVSQDSLLRYRCTACKSEHYISGTRWTSLFSEKGRKRNAFKSVIDWCQNGKHRIPDKPFTAIIDTMRIFEQLFGQRFDDCDDMIAANNKFLNGIYFTGYCRQLKIGFVHTMDPFYSKNNQPLINWCVLRDIKLIVVSDIIYESILSSICTNVIKLGIRTRFDNLLVGDIPTEVTAEYYRATQMCACLLIEGKLPFTNRM